MKNALLGILFFVSLAFGQASEEAKDFVGKLPSGLRLLPEGFFRPRATSTISNLFKLEPIKTTTALPWRAVDDNSDANATVALPQITTAIELQMQTAVVRGNLYPVDGSLSKQLGHVFIEALGNVGKTNVLNTTYAPWLDDNSSLGSRLDYRRSHDTVRLLLAPFMSSLRVSLKAQILHDLRRLR